jgi:hypothetical protein
MPGQFINRANLGNLKLVNNSNAGNLAMNTATVVPSYYSWQSSNTVGGNNPGDKCTPAYSIVLYAFTNDITVLANADFSPSNFLYTNTSLTTKFTGNPPGIGGYYKITLLGGDGTGYACDFGGDGHIGSYSTC